MVNQIDISASGVLVVASSEGLMEQQLQTWARLQVLDREGRAWGVKDALGVAFDPQGRLWFASRAGVGCRAAEGWKFYEGKDGLPWNDFTGITAAPDGGPDASRLGRKDLAGGRPGGGGFVAAVGAVAVAPRPFRVRGHRGRRSLIERRPMTWQPGRSLRGRIENANARVRLRRQGPLPLRRRPALTPRTAITTGSGPRCGGECFAQTTPFRSQGKEFSAKPLRRFVSFKVTQGGKPAPQYIARTIRPVSWPDQTLDDWNRIAARMNPTSFGRFYEPRSRSGWKMVLNPIPVAMVPTAITFLSAILRSLCRKPNRRERLRESSGDIPTICWAHGFVLIDHDGLPTRWAI